MKNLQLLPIFLLIIPFCKGVIPDCDIKKLQVFSQSKSRCVSACGTGMEKPICYDKPLLKKHKRNPNDDLGVKCVTIEKFDEELDSKCQCDINLGVVKQNSSDKYSKCIEIEKITTESPSPKNDYVETENIQNRKFPPFESLETETTTQKTDTEIKKLNKIEIILLVISCIVVLSVIAVIFIKTFRKKKYQRGFTKMQ